MGLRIIELFGHTPADQSPAAVQLRHTEGCPFSGTRCTKPLRDVVSGVCTVQQVKGGPVICCPVRLYADNYRIMGDIAVRAFGEGVQLIKPEDAKHAKHDGKKVVMFGKHSGGELQLPRINGRGGYFVDWILARIGTDGQLAEFVAVEVQSIDTTGSYREEREAYLSGRVFEGYSKAGLNWENVSKRILPQIIYKGHVLRREQLCMRGLFFVCPAPVYQRIHQRLGGHMLQYTNLQPGSLTFLWYDVGPTVEHGQRRGLTLEGEFRTTVDQVALAFTSPSNLPPANVYEQAIRTQLNRR